MRRRHRRFMGGAKSNVVMPALVAGIHVSPASRHKEDVDGSLRSTSNEPSIIIALPLARGGTDYGPAVIRVRTAKSAVTGNHLRDALFEGLHAAIVNKCSAAPIRAGAPWTLVSLARANVEQQCRCHRHHDEYELHGSSPAYTDACRPVSRMPQVSQLIAAQRN